MKRLVHGLAGGIAVTLLVSCSTPPQALDQANNGVRLTKSLQLELERYQRHAALSARRRLDSIARLEVGAGEIARDQAYAAYLDTEAGKTQEMQARVRIRDASDTYAKLVADEERSRDELATRLAALVADLPAPAGKLGAVQKALADLGTELSMADRVALVTKFLDEAKAIVDQNVAAAEGAVPEPAPPPASAASAPEPAASTASSPGG
jgi:hypothetical protein